MSDLIGRTIKQYRLDALLGDGGMGTVYKAYDTNLDRTVAVKLMHAHFARQPEFRARLTQEAKTAAQLEHPSIVRIYDFGESEQGLYIAMEYIGGGSLRAHIQRLQRLGKFLPLAQALQIGFQIAEALDYAHERGIIHRDVKPGNIILKPLNRPENEGEQPFRAVLTDFGLVKLSEGSVLTQEGLTMGTPMYMSPEQCQGETLDGRSDLYALGVVLYELVTNKLPFEFKSLADALAAHIRGDMPPPASERRPDAPALIDAILSRLLAKNPDDRFEDGAHMAKILKSAIFSLGDTPTRIIKRPPSQDPVLAQTAETAPAGFSLLIQSEGSSNSYLPLQTPIITIGRDADNDMVLAAEGVSRSHVRLQATETGWAVVDLGGVNGTFVNNRRLRPNELTPLEVGDQIQVGPYELKLEGPLTQTEEDAEETEAPASAPPSEPAQPAPITLDPDPPNSEPSLIVNTDEMPTEPPQETAVTGESDSGRLVIDIPDPLGLFLTRERLAAEPGKVVELHAEIVNRTTIDDRVRLKLDGLPAQWIELPDGFVDAPANGSAKITVRIKPPRSADTPVGRQRFRVSVVSQRFSDSDASVNGSLLLAGYNAFTASLEQKETPIPHVVNVTVRNDGNTPNTYAIKLDENEHIKFREPVSPIQLNPGQSNLFTLELDSNKLLLFGTSSNTEYKLRVAAKTGEVKALTGHAELKPLLSVGVAYILMITAVVFLGAMIVVFLSRSNSSLFGFNASPTPQAFAFASATPTFSPELATAQAISASMTIEAATATAVAIANEGDLDQDGLSDAQERLEGIESDPNNPDTDADGLSDGDEVNRYGTSPTRADTDGDILNDNDEIFVYGTDPRRWDTDGDGLSDGAEISQRTNPLDRDDPVFTSGPTPTPTIAPTQTATGSPTPTPEATSTNNPTATPTSTPTATATNNPTATPTPTIPSTSTATATATATSTVPPSPTATSTATPVVVVSPTTDPGTNLDLLVLSCVAPPPTLDGNLTPQEWGNTPLATFQSATDPIRTVALYATRDSENLYLAFRIAGSQANTDSLRVYVDTANNGGDPDTADRLFQIGRDGTQVIRIGTGNNADDNNWSDYTSDDWIVADGGDDLFWNIEMQVNVAAELNGLANPFGLGAMVIYGGDVGEMVVWPQGISSELADTWEDVGNVSCTS